MANGFTFGGRHSDSFSLRMTARKVPIMPPLKDQYQDIPGFDGVWDFGSRFDARTIEIDCVLLADSKSDFQTKLRNLAGALNPRLGSQVLIFDDEPDKQYFARITGQLPLEQIGSFGKFTLQLICPDPFVYSKLLANVSGALPLTVVHNGTYFARPVLTITATGAGTLTNKHPDGTTEVLTITAGGTYVVDCKEFTITQNGAGAYKFVSGDFFSLFEGSNTITATGGITNVQVSFRHTWL